MMDAQVVIRVERVDLDRGSARHYALLDSGQEPTRTWVSCMARTEELGTKDRTLRIRISRCSARTRSLCDFGRNTQVEVSWQGGSGTRDARATGVSPGDRAGSAGHLHFCERPSILSRLVAGTGEAPWLEGRRRVLMAGTLIGLGVFGQGGSKQERRGSRLEEGESSGALPSSPSGDTRRCRLGSVEHEAR